MNHLFANQKMRRDHWVPDSKATHCASPGCGKLFDSRNRRHHCRRCGLVFCEAHTSHRMRLDLNAEPCEQGEWSKACEACFLSQHHPPPIPTAGSNHVLVVHVGGEVVRRSRSELFLAHRAAYNEQMRRRAKPITEAYEKVRTMQSRRDRKQVVSWEPDSKTPCCRQLCGVVCGAAPATHHATAPPCATLPTTTHLTPHTTYLTPHASHHTPHTTQHTQPTTHLTPHTTHLAPHTSHLKPHTITTLHKFHL